MPDEKDLELLAYEVALLVRGGWRLYNGTWSHVDAPEPAYERSVALGVQRNWDRNRERFSCARPAHAPAPSQEPATVPRPGMVPGTLQPPVRPSPVAPPPTVQEGPPRKRRSNSPLSKTRS